MTRITLGALMLAAATATGAEEGVAGVAAGHKVRLTPSGSGRFTATVVEVQEDALIVRTAPDAAPTRFRLDGLRRLEVARGRRGHVLQGALIGFVPGFLLGAAAGQAIGCDEQGPGCSDPRAELVGGAMLGGLSALAGGLVGLAIRTDRWERVPLGRGSARVAAMVVPLRGGAGARVTLSF